MKNLNFYLNHSFYKGRIGSILEEVFMPNIDSENKMPDDLNKCVEFHGHICPGLIYGYRVAKEAMKLMGIIRSVDEEVVAIC